MHRRPLRSAGAATLAAALAATGLSSEAEGVAGPSTPACDYALAIALGLQASDQPSTARGGLAQMVMLLRRAAMREPDLDRGGPDRVLAVVLVRAPVWPLGPGDPEEGLVVARRALALAEEAAAAGEPEAPDWVREARTRAVRE